MKNLLITLIAIMISISVSHAESYTLDEYLAPEFGDFLGEDKGELFELLHPTLGGEGYDISTDTITAITRHNLGIKAITFYMAKNHNHINGIEIEYTDGQLDAHGSTNGNKNRQVVSGGDHINSFNVFAKDCSTNNSKITRARFMTANGNKLWYGKGRNHDCSDLDERGGAYKLVGLYGYHKNGKVYGLGPIWMRNFDFEVEAVVTTPLEGSIGDNGEDITVGENMNVYSEIRYTYNQTGTSGEKTISMTNSIVEGVSQTWEQSSELSKTLGFTLGLEVTYGSFVWSGEFSREVTSTETQTIGEETFEEVLTEVSDSQTLLTAPDTVYNYRLVSTVYSITQPYELHYTDLNSCDEDGENCDSVVFEGTISEATERSTNLMMKRVAGLTGMTAYLDESRLTQEEITNAQLNLNANGYDVVHVNCLSIPTQVGCETYNY